MKKNDTILDINNIKAPLKCKQSQLIFQVLGMYEKEKFDFLEKVFNSTDDFLEDLTGLSELRNLDDCDVLDFSDDDF